MTASIDERAELVDALDEGRCLALASNSEVFPIRPNNQDVRAILAHLSQPAQTKREVLKSLSSITEHLLADSYTLALVQQATAILVVLRAGLAMWHPLALALDNKPTWFLRSSRDKSAATVAIDRFPAAEIRGGMLLILDPIIATGGTLATVARQAIETTDGDIRILALSCYGAPAGIARLLGVSPRVRISIGCIAEAVDRAGFVQPPTNGDIGDKLFGRGVCVP